MLSRLRPRDDIEQEGATICAVMEEDEISWDFDGLANDQIFLEHCSMPEYQLGLN